MDMRICIKQKENENKEAVTSKGACQRSELDTLHFTWVPELGL